MRYLLLLLFLVLPTCVMAQQDEYLADLNTAGTSLETFWSQEFPRIERGHHQWRSLQGIFQYDMNADNSRIPCQPEGLNAYYCRNEDVIVLEEPHLLRPWYQEYGDFAPAYALAHEWGHAVQFRLGILQSPNVAPIMKELQADCLAGAWAAFAEDQQHILEDGDIDEAVQGLLAVRDRGIPWLNPQAHGNGAQRIEAFLGGRRNGSWSCLTPGNEPRVVPR
jgi:predicted metalloprotease